MGRHPTAAALLTLLLLLPAAVARADAYLLGPRDVISITVYEQKDLTKQVRVGEDGTISLPLVGQVAAAGLSVDQLSQSLVTAYREFIYEPQVSVYIEEYHSMEVSVLGQVGSPGLYQLAGDSTLLELLSKVGGFTKDAGDRLVIMRRPQQEGGEPERITVDTRKLFGPEGTVDNVKVIDGDTINVPKADFFFVFGEVEEPGSYKMERDSMLTVMKAISIAGGFTDKASKRGVKITRDVGGQTMDFKIEMNTQVQPEDIIVVPESFF